MRLADLCDLATDQVNPEEQSDALYIGLEHIAPGRLEWIGEGKASEVRSGKFAFRAGDVLYGKLRPYLDKAVLATESGICTTELLVLRPKERVDPRFLACVVHAPQFVEHAVAGTTGVQHPRTSWSHISDFELPDFGQDEQTAIARLLWAVHEAISANALVVDRCRELKRAAMKALFSRGLNGEPQKETEIGPVPESWEVVPLGALGRVGNGSTPRKSVRAYWEGGTFPWLTSAKVYDRRIKSADFFVTEAALRECHLPQLEPGTILIAITGQGRTLGHCAVLQIHATVSQHLAYVATDTTRAIPEFVCAYLESRYEYLRKVGSAGGSTKGALTCGFLREMPIPLPAPDKQREVISILDTLDRKIEVHRRKREVLEELFKSLLHKLMTGEVRVTDLDLSALEREPVAAEAG